MSEQFKDFIETIKGYSNGALEKRSVLIEDSELMLEKKFAKHLNNFADKVETFLRESLLSLKLHSRDTKQLYRIDPRGFNGVFLNALTKFNNELDISLEQREKIKAMLESLGQALMIIDKDGNIEDGFSLVSENIFGQSPKGKTFFDILQLDDTSKSSVKDWLEMLFDEPLPFDDLMEAGPSSFQKNDNKYIEIAYKPIRDSNDKIFKIVVTGTDKTQEQLLERKSKEEKAYVKSILALIKDRDNFLDFAEEFNSNLLISKNEIEKDEPNIDQLFRSMHSVKGGSASFGLINIQEMAHKLEDQLSNIRDLDSNLRAESILNYKMEFLERIIDLEKMFQDFLDQNKEIIGDMNTRSKEVSFASLENFANVLKNSAADSSLHEKFVSKFIAENIAQSFIQYENVVNKTKEKLFKEVKLEIENTDINIVLKKLKPLMGALVHAFRNAVDHGIEDPDEREMMGKPREGKIRVSFSYENTRLRIEISDDGSGIDPKKIALIAFKKGLITKEEISNKTKEEIIQYVLKPNFSSKEEVSDISGRGVGLDAISYEAKKLNGQAWVRSVLGQGSTFIIDVSI